MQLTRRRRRGRRESTTLRALTTSALALGGLANIAKADTPIDEIVTSYYLRMRVDDKPGVLADITRILADRTISIDAMIQREPEEGEEQVDIIMLTHQTQEKNVNAAIAAIEALPVVTGRITRIRLEELGRH